MRTQKKKENWPYHIVLVPKLVLLVNILTDIQNNKLYVDFFSIKLKYSVGDNN